MNKKKSIAGITQLEQQKVYELVTKDRIEADSPCENHSREFPVGARAYRWTNESLVSLEEELQLNLNEKDMLIVSASGDPFATFAYLGARNQIGFDTSHRAVLWSELKLQALKELSYQDFLRFTCIKCDDDSCGDSESTKKNNSQISGEIYTQRLAPKLSPYAKSLFDKLFEKHKNMAGIIKSNCFFRGSGCTSYFPKCNIYTSNEEKYEQTRQRIRGNNQIVVPASLSDVLNLTNEKFGGFYGSNILDHFRDGNGNLDYSEETIQGFLEVIDSKLNVGGYIILQFEWSDDVRERARKILQGMGYEFRIAKSSKGYGRISASQKTK